MKRTTYSRLNWNRAAQAALMGTNTAVVGLLLAAFYDPIWTAAITEPSRLAFALAGGLFTESMPKRSIDFVVAALGTSGRKPNFAPQMRLRPLESDLLDTL